MKKLTVLTFLTKFRFLYTPDFNVEFIFSVKDLLKDIVNNRGSSSAINLGVVTYQKKDESEDECLIIDGTQRLVTFSLLLYALCECYKKTSSKNQDSITKIHERYLFSGDKTKIRLVESLDYIYSKILNSETLTDDEKTNPLFLVLHEFWQEIKKDGLQASFLFKELSRVNILLEESNSEMINPRDLYFLLNFKNENINQIELISHYLREIVPDDFGIWVEIVELFNKNNLQTFLILFLKDFLTIYFRGKVPWDCEIYLDFKKYFEQLSRYEEASSILKRLGKYAEYYLKLVQSNFDDFEVKKQLILINETREINTYPYLMEVLDDFENQRMSKQNFIEILTTINIFLQSKLENDSEVGFNFATLSDEINKLILLNKKDSITINDLTS